MHSCTDRKPRQATKEVLLQKEEGPPHRGAGPGRVMCHQGRAVSQRGKQGWRGCVGGGAEEPEERVLRTQKRGYWEPYGTVAAPLLEERAARGSGTSPSSDPNPSFDHRGAAVGCTCCEPPGRGAMLPCPRRHMSPMDPMSRLEEVGMGCG